MKSIIGSILLALGMTVLAGSVWAQDDHSDHVLEVSRALPPELIEGPHFRVVDPVVNVFALDQFHVESDFGDFDAYGQLMLRIRIREVIAIATLKEYDVVAAAGGSLVVEGKETIKAAGQIVMHPIKSTKGIARGLANRFKKIGRNIQEDIATARSKATKAEKSAIYADRWLGVDKAKRKLAAELMVDPYSTNQLLQVELNRVARVDAGARIGTKLLIPSIPGVSLLHDVHEIVTTYDLRELLAYNERRLQSLGASKEDINYFLSMDAFNPTGASLLISLILELDDVENQIALFNQALITDSDVDALFFIECVTMAVWYHKNQAPLEKLLLVTGLPAAETLDHDVVVFAATDFPHWTHDQAGIIEQLDAAYKPISARPKLLLAGNASGTFKREVEAMDWEIMISVRNEYLPTVPWAIRNEELLGTD